MQWQGSHDESGKGYGMTSVEFVGTTAPSAGDAVVFDETDYTGQTLAKNMRGYRVTVTALRAKPMVAGFLDAVPQQIHTSTTVNEANYVPVLATCYGHVPNATMKDATAVPLPWAMVTEGLAGAITPMVAGEEDAVCGFGFGTSAASTVTPFEVFAKCL